MADNDEELTELAVPQPISPEEPRGPSLEGAESRTSRQDRKSEDAELTELAVPQPVSPEESRGDSLEAAESRASHDRRDGGADPDNSAQREKPEDEETGHTSNGSGERQMAEQETQNLQSHWTTDLYIISWLIFFSFLGTLARLGVEAITLYPNSPFPSRVLWANIGGSFTIGFLTEDRRLFGQEWGSPDPKAPASNHGKVKKTIPLYIGLATGFCGSFTSFSSYIRDCFLALTNALQGPSPTSPYHVDSKIAHRSGGFSFLALVAILIIHPAMSLAALRVGGQFALLLQPVTPTLPFRLLRRVLDPMAVLLAFGCWLGAVFLAIWPPGDDTHWRFRAVMPLIFAPPGCLLRFYASKHMNALVPSFPMGTFAVNIFGTAVLGMIFDLQHATAIGASDLNACVVLEGIMEGFCGCLTTVSTWVAEINGLRRRHAWIYGSASAGLGLALMVIIMGSMGWTVGFSDPACK